MESHRSNDEGRDREEQKMKAVLIDPNPPPAPARRCPRCNSDNTKFCYYNNYSQSQPRHFCKTCRRYWTEGGALRNIPVGGSNRRYKRPRYDAVPNQLIVPSQALLSRSSLSSPYLCSTTQINSGCSGTGFFSSLMKLQSMSVDPYEAFRSNYNLLYGGNYGTGLKMPKIDLGAGGDDRRWRNVAAAGVRVPEVQEGDEDDEVKPDLHGVDGDGASGSGTHQK